ncbi:lytic transglycosylase domain-containing protein [uncultured Alsobacter sp.]|uniref:lytic murein transglycosylase n=1 Tax=uncultured Alsobacter sp. TaxID=1748258 RepID=UPI0025D5DE6E|nr:lytic transglycosylase domain-containing protein [uncultured Alsobacter sp.]
MTAACLLAAGGVARAAECGNSSGGFETWKRQMAEEARGAGHKPATIAALMGTTYSHATIGADRGQKSFKLSLSEFMKKRGSAAIVSQGRQRKASQAAFFAGLEKRFGVPPGPLLAIWGMESGFGAFTGKQNTLSAVATLAYDCRRTEYFTDQLGAMLTLIDAGTLSVASRGAMHGEVGQTQFLPKNVLQYGVDGDGNGRIDLDTMADALASTANFLKGHGWKPGAGYQPGQPNFVAIQGWNAASVYQQSIAIMGRQIDGGED